MSSHFWTRSLHSLHRQCQRLLHQGMTILPLTSQEHSPCTLGSGTGRQAPETVRVSSRTAFQRHQTGDVHYGLPEPGPRN